MHPEIFTIPEVPLENLGTFLGTSCAPPPASGKNLSEWRMEEDDAPIFRYIYSAFRPKRHLEFGTWKGFGTCLCLDSCDAEVWTINIADGETRLDGSWAYGERLAPGQTISPDDVVVNFGKDEFGPQTWLRTDAGGAIGRLYREKGLAHRVHQIYCDSRELDITPYAENFFDSILIDGGHTPEIVTSDTRKALKILRPGGLIIWHDFCPRPEIAETFESVIGVTTGLAKILPEIHQQTEKMAWIRPSWILIGIKK